MIDDGRGMTLMPELYAQQGYGLNNMRERAGAIGGEFQIESKPGEGTRVVVDLPRPAPMSREVKRTMNAVAKLPVRKIRVILADDHPVVRDGLAAIVNQQPDMQVVAEAGDGAEALELYEQHKPDVMVLDLRMPKLRRRRRRAEGARETPEGLPAHHDHVRRRRRHLSFPEPGRQGLPAEGRATHRRSSRRSAPWPTTGRIPPRASPPRRCSACRSPASRRASSTCCSSWPKAAATRTSRAASTITEGTAKTHVKAILGKLDAISRTEAVAVAHKRGLIRL